jgi:predicted dehydrogenase
MASVTLLVVGAGGRGFDYARYVREHPDGARIVGVAEPREPYRRRMAAEHDIPPENVFTDWKQAAAREKLADAVLVCTPDALHADPAVAFARKGYAMLLEKPIAPSEADCRRVVEAVMRAKIIFAVAHVLRYTRYTRVLKAMLDAGAVGDLVSVQHLENVGWWHQAHAFVRGFWRNEKESSFMLLSKSCHDLDWIRYVFGKRCLKVSSFGSLKHFRKAEKPPQAGSARRCVECEYEPQCPYSAKKIYLTGIRDDRPTWPSATLVSEWSVANVAQAVAEGPWGRCVYECDNDVVDNQVVIMEFEGGRTACFTMTAFNAGGHRKTRLFGTRGEIYGDGSNIEHFDFLTRQRRIVDTNAADGTIAGGHGGGDEGLMGAFLAAVARRDQDLVLTGAQETLQSHLMVFAAERARRENRVVSLG